MKRTMPKNARTHEPTVYENNLINLYILIRRERYIEMKMDKHILLVYIYI